MFIWKDRLRAAAIHFCISLAIAVLAALLVFGLWFPYPYREISGGRDLFILLVSIDVLLGPLITFFIFNRAKPRRELRRDLAVVGLIQLAALAYGLWTMFLARPVHLVFEIDRLRVVHAVDVPPELLERLPPGVQAMPLTGPTLLAARPFRDARESYEATMAAVQGLAIAARPDFWTPYASATAQVLQAAKPVAALKARFPEQAGAIDASLGAAGADPGKAVWLPMVGRRNFWVAFLDPTSAQMVAFLPLDPF